MEINISTTINHASRDTTRLTVIFSIVLIGIVVLFIPPDVHARQFVEGGASFSSLDNGFEDHNSQWGHLITEPSDRFGYVLGARSTDHFGERDITLSTSAYGSLWSGLTAQGHLNYSPTHNVSPIYSLGGQVGLHPGNKFHFNAGWTVSDYDNADSSVHYGAFTISRSIAGVSVGYTNNPSWVGSEGPSFTHVLHVSETRDEYRLNVDFTLGEQIQLTAGNDVQLVDVVGIAVSGDYRLRRPLYLTYELSYLDLDEFYAKTTLGGGLRYRF